VPKVRVKRATAILSQHGAENGQIQEHLVEHIAAFGSLRMYLTATKMSTRPPMTSHQKRPIKLLKPMTIFVGSGQIDTQLMNHVGKNRHHKFRQHPTTRQAMEMTEPDKSRPTSRRLQLHGFFPRRWPTLKNGIENTRSRPFNHVVVRSSKILGTGACVEAWTAFDTLPTPVRHFWRPGFPVRRQDFRHCTRGRPGRQSCGKLPEENGGVLTGTLPVRVWESESLPFS